MPRQCACAGAGDSTSACRRACLCDSVKSPRQLASNGTCTLGPADLGLGSFKLLAPGASSTNLQVGLDTASAGLKSGSAGITFVSDANNIDALAAGLLARRRPQLYRQPAARVSRGPFVPLMLAQQQTVDAAAKLRKRGVTIGLPSAAAPASGPR
jgi:hypothetical protein